MKKFNTMSMKGTQLCSIKRDNQVSLTSGSTNFEKYDMIRSTIFAFKYSDIDDIIDVEACISEYFDKSYQSYSMVERKTAKSNTIALVRRYLQADSRKCAKPKPFNFTFQGIPMVHRPDFVFESTEMLNGKRIPCVEVVHFSAGRQKISYKDGSSLDSSISSMMSTLGAIMYGIHYANNHDVYCIKVSYQALKSDKDEITAPYEENAISKSHCSSALYYFKDKKWIMTRYGRDVRKDVGRIKNSNKFALTERTSKNPFVKFAKSLAKFLGSEKCSMENCKKCNLYELCHYTYAPVPESEEPVIRSLSGIKLAEEQKAIVEAESGIFRVLATAGAGKTFCMVFRLMRLLQKGYLPQNMLILSFSNIAVDELKSRIKSFLIMFGLDSFFSADDFPVMTFNSFCQRIIDKFYLDLGFVDKPIPVEDIDKMDAIIQVLQHSKFELDGFDYENPLFKIGNHAVGVVPKLMKVFDEINAKNIQSFAEYDSLLSLSNNITRSLGTSLETTARHEYSIAFNTWLMYEEYRAILKERNLITFADQPNLVAKLLDIGVETGHDYINETYEVEHLIVDEFQDSDLFQLTMIKELIQGTQFTSCMVVGDDSQAIYGFRNTSPDNIINFPSLIGIKVQDLTLNETRRFGGNIAEISNAIISKNTSRVDKEIVSHQPNNPTPRLVKFNTSKEEYEWIAKEINKLLLAGEKPEDICVLTCKNDTLKAVQKTLVSQDIPTIRNAEAVLSNSKVKAVIHLCRFLLDFNEENSLLVYLNDLYDNTFLALGWEKMEQIVNLNKEKFIPLYLSLDSKSRKKVFLNLLTAVDTGRDQTYSVFLQKIVEKSRTLGVDELIAYILKCDRYQVSDEVKLEGLYESVTLSTIWRAKGGEWKHVFATVSDMDSSSKSYSLAEMEEKRRLIFTMVTRTKCSLTLSSVEEVVSRTNNEIRRPNRFYEELRTLGEEDGVSNSRYFEHLSPSKPLLTEEKTLA